ncbi:MAG: peptidylprolyl isomerase [Pseudomonadota bacterium]|nr:peptidylprolyl isomerase [Pseudomonadota bacterium]
MKYFLAFVFLCTLAQTSNSQLIDQAIVIIGDDVITEREFVRRFEFVKIQYRLTGRRIEDEESLKKELLDHLVDVRLHLNFAKENNINLSTVALNNAMQNLAKRSGSSLEVFREKIIDEGLDYDLYRKQIQEDLIVQQVKRSVVAANVQASQQEIKDFLEHKSDLLKVDSEYKISMILIPDSSSGINAEDKIRSIRDRIIKGEKFSDLALSYSQSSNAVDGGDMGWRKLKDIPTVFHKYLDSLIIGQISDVIANEDNFYLIYLEDKKDIDNFEVEESLARHILIKTNAIIDDETAIAKLSSLKYRLENGENFSDLARAHSDDKVSAANGGDLGWIGPGATVPKFEEQLSMLNINEISDPFLTQFGWHIIKVIDKRKQNNSKAIRENMARRYIIGSKSNEVLDEWIKKVRGQTFIKYLLTFENQEINPIVIEENWDPFS